MLTVSPLINRGAIERILSDPWISSKLATDEGPPRYIDHPLLTYRGAYVDGDLAGLFVAVAFTRWEVEVHAALLRPALTHSLALARLFLAQVFAEPEVQRATAYVMGSLPTAANWVRKLGFVDEGRRRDACRVGGAATDVLVLGLTRAE